MLCPDGITIRSCARSLTNFPPPRLHVSPLACPASAGCFPFAHPTTTHRPRTVAYPKGSCVFLLALSFLFASHGPRVDVPPRRIDVAMEASSDVRRAALDGIRDGEVVYLDISFRQEVEGCAWQAQETEFKTLPPAGDHHLVVMVLPGAPDRFPFNALTCEYDSGGRGPQARWGTRLRGFFAAVSGSIPTARELRLHPVRLADVARESAIVRSPVRKP